MPALRSVATPAPAAARRPIRSAPDSAARGRERADPKARPATPSVRPSIVRRVRTPRRAPVPQARRAAADADRSTISRITRGARRIGTRPRPNRPIRRDRNGPTAPLAPHCGERVPSTSDSDRCDGARRRWPSQGTVPRGLRRRARRRCRATDRMGREPPPSRSRSLRPPYSNVATRSQPAIGPAGVVTASREPSLNHLSKPRSNQSARFPAVGGR